VTVFPAQLLRDRVRGREVSGEEGGLGKAAAGVVREAAASVGDVLVIAAGASA
jgi:hypothetical protein